MTEPVAIRAERIAHRIGLVLPPGSRVEFAKVIERDRDEVAGLIVTMPESSWNDLRARLSLSEGDLMADQNSNLDAPPDGGWQPDKAVGLASAQVPWRGGLEALNVGVAPAGTGRKRVFILWYQV